MDMYLQGLSVVIIARNAEKTIAKCLQSISAIASEIIVVINDCVDDTKSIAESYGARVIEHQWSGFKDQKNFALSLARYEWILSLDSDESLNNTAKSSIKSVLDASKNEFVAAKFARKTLFLNKWVAYGDWYPDYNLRFFKNGSGKFVGGNVHEKLEVSGDVKILPGNILHYTCDSLEDFTKKNIHYAELAAEDMFKKFSGKFSGKLRANIFGIIFRSCWKFVRSYFLKFGILDGVVGYYIAKNESFLTFYKYFRFRSLILQKE